MPKTGKVLCDLTLPEAPTSAAGGDTIHKGHDVTVTPAVIPQQALPSFPL
jgi:hypothetical protein